MALRRIFFARILSAGTGILKALQRYKIHARYSYGREKASKFLHLNAVIIRFTTPPTNGNLVGYSKTSSFLPL